jgi:4'-phosphopantetheinyl transferase
MNLFGIAGKKGDRLAIMQLLKYGVMRIWGLDELPNIARTKQGKPWFPGYPDHHFNLSHSGSFALCGLSTTPIGVDIEQVTPGRGELARYILGKQELRKYNEFAEKDELLHIYWTLKESYCKCTGEGLKLPPVETTFDIDIDGFIRSNRTGYAFKSLKGNDWCGAVCVQGDIGLMDIEWIEQ